jgi:hypothetical protein
MECIALLLGTGWVVTAVCLYRLYQKITRLTSTVNYLNENSLGSYNKKEVDRVIFPQARDTRYGTGVILASTEDLRDITAYCFAQIKALAQHLKVELKYEENNSVTAKNYTVTKLKR